MLKKISRIRRDADFKKVFKSSRPFSVGRLAIRVRTSGLPESRFGFVISNKIDKRATKRNALKRRLRALAREKLPSIKKGFDLVVLVRQGYPSPLDYEIIKNDFLALLKGAKVLDD